MQFGELIATALANAEARADLRQVADEQAALRRVATRVARGEPPSAVFAAVAVEAGHVIPAADVALVGRYDPDDTIEFVGGWSRDGDASFVGDRVALGGHNVSTLVFQSNHPARSDHIPDDSTPASALARKWARSSAGAPINVEGRLWGVMIVGGADEDALPAGTEDRLAQFSELVATAIGNAEAREELRRVADEQAALRRVATVVARDEAPEAAFAAVAEELGHLFGAEATGVNRYEVDGTVTSVGSWNSLGEPIAGTRTTLGGRNVTTLVFETEQPARIDRYDADDSSPATSIARRHGARSAAGAPIRVAGRLWGSVQVAMSREAALPARTEERLAAFAELTASAIARAQAREELQRVADDQAALRRVATLVAHAAPPAEVFAAVAAEVGRLLSMEGAGVLRYDGDRSATVVGGWSGTGDAPRIGLTIPLGGHNAVTRVFETGRPTRIEYAADDSNAATARGREAGGRVAIGAPIGVAGRLWGAVVLVSRDEDPLTAENETRLVAFTELVATAIANAQVQADLAASRARVVASADETRRRIERDLHDGAQAQLVTLVLQVRAAQEVLPPDDPLAAELERVATGLTSALDELRELASGVHPPILASGGLGPAVRMLGRRARIPVDVDVRTDGRLPEPIEVGAYYVVSEAITNAVKHSAATSVTVEIEAADNMLRIRVQDDGVGGAEFAGGSGLVGLRDRVEALGGRIAVQSKPGLGTSLSVELPLSPDPAAVASR